MLPGRFPALQQQLPVPSLGSNGLSMELQQSLARLQDSVSQDATMAAAAVGEDAKPWKKALAQMQVPQRRIHIVS